MSSPDFDDIRAARRGLDDVISEIRKLPGFEGFLAQPTMADIRAAASECPIAYFAAAEPCGLALVVRGDQVVHVPLTRLTGEVLYTRIEAHRTSYARFIGDQDGQADWTAALDDTTRWLWDDVVGPVWAELAGASQVVLVAGGLLGLLPLHAAWTPDSTTVTGRRFALDAMPVSYAPNARSLTSARALARGSAERLLAVAEPASTGFRPLPTATAEARAASSWFPGEALVLSGSAVTAARLAEELPRVDVAHLACHGVANLTAPLESQLFLAGDDSLRLRDLLVLDLRLRLAVLSACETSMPGTELPDEVVALPTALLQAGAGGVIASLWAVRDRATTMLMTDFYRRWRGDALPPAVALGQSQRWLRDTTNQEKIETYQQAVDEGAEWLPPEAAAEFISTLEYSEPEARGYESLHSWAAFTLIGA